MSTCTKGHSFHSIFHICSCSPPIPLMRLRCETLVESHCNQKGRPHGVARGKVRGYRSSRHPRLFSRKCPRVYDKENILFVETLTLCIQKAYVEPFEDWISGVRGASSHFRAVYFRELVKRSLTVAKEQKHSPRGWWSGRGWGRDVSRRMTGLSTVSVIEWVMSRALLCGHKITSRICCVALRCWA